MNAQTHSEEDEEATSSSNGEAAGESCSLNRQWLGAQGARLDCLYALDSQFSSFLTSVPSPIDAH